MRSVTDVVDAMFQAIRNEITPAGKVPYSVAVVLQDKGLSLILKHDEPMLEPEPIWVVTTARGVERMVVLDSMKALKTLGNDYIRELNTSVTGHEDTSSEYTDDEDPLSAQLNWRNPKYD